MTPVTAGSKDVTHCVPANLKGLIRKLVVRKKFGNNRTALRATFHQCCSKCNKQRNEITHAFSHGLTVENDLLPELVKKLEDCCAAETKRRAVRGAHDALWNPKAAKRRKRAAEVSGLQERIAALEAELAVVN